MAFQIQALVLFSVAFLCDYCFSQDQKGDPLRAENRKNFCLLDQDYFFNIRQNESGIILKIGNTLFHPDTERYLTCKLRHLLIYGMKKMAVHANYTDDKLDEFYLRNRNQVKKKMCDIFLKIYNDFTFQGVIETKKFIQERTFSGRDYNAMRNGKEIKNFWKLDDDFEEKTHQIRMSLRKTLTNLLVYFEKCYYYYYYRRKSLALRAYQWHHPFFDDGRIDYFQFEMPE
ncbi:uncharacterized protein LOC103513591 isoform X2 [Diaphorina citri]|uniref:Uncharacterized protein LOC103513591 isoform X2 n=1 Tax=Diaphorina citri TaxID=121845 RepID=A0A1S3D8I4_DIACI|nr:uncharacterized protein LOC103513591 isoform X2 [Diaphorina citri]